MQASTVVDASNESFDEVLARVVEHAYQLSRKYHTSSHMESEITEKKRIAVQLLSQFERLERVGPSAASQTGPEPIIIVMSNSTTAVMDNMPQPSRHTRRNGRGHRKYDQAG